MQIIAYSRWDELLPHAESWDRLAGSVPFRCWAWLSTWWRHYGPSSPEDPDCRLMVLCAVDGSGRLAGVAPWYLQRCAAKGRVLRWLGSGEVCSDYAGVHCALQDADRVSEAIAAYLTGPHCAPGTDRCWDLLEIDGVDGEDATVGRLLQHLGERGCSQHENSPLQTWRVALPDSWEEFLAMLSKGHRKKLRRAERELFASGRAALRTVETCDQLGPAMDVLIDLHQKRWRALGGPGCFASPRFESFHRDVAQRLLLAGQLQLHWIELDGRTVAAEYQLFSQGITYSYLAGLDPDCLDEEPGHLLHAATLRRALEQGGRAVDFLRGDEPYKPHFRAVPRRQLALRVVPDRVLSRIRNNLWLAGRGVKRWVMERSS